MPCARMAFVDVLLGFGRAKWCHSLVKFNGESRGWHPFLPIPNRWGDISRSSTNLGPNSLQPILAPIACIGAHSVNPIPGHMFASNRANPHWGPCASTLATQTWIHGPTWLCKQEFQFSGAHHGQVCNLILHSPRHYVVGLGVG